MDLPSKIRSVDPSVALSSDVEIVASELGETLIEVLEASEGILGLRHITVEEIFGGVSQRETNAGRALNVKEVGAHVPGVRIWLDNSFAVIKYVGTVLLEKTKHRGAARTTVEPNEDRVSSGLVKRFNEDIVQLPLGTSDVKVATVPSGWQRSTVRQRLDLVSHVVSSLDHCEA